ncbi:hypothetical protein O77CONTIG1_01791 [Leptolyngbya sp. O-77]|nr:hypothetical protein O77CONTIG1_01791 [Leptolyngbya sp. O-77]
MAWGDFGFWIGDSNWRSWDGFGVLTLALLLHYSRTTMASTVRFPPKPRELHEYPMSTL